MTYVGNQLHRSDDRADYLSYAGANDLPNGVAQYSYDANGNMSSDSGRGIRSISYKRLNLPENIYFEGGSSVSFAYDALGRKMKRTDTLWDAPSIGSPASARAGVLPTITTTLYYGRLMRTHTQGGVGTLAPSRILIPGGYLTPEGDGYAYHYFVNDYQGNVRAVVGGNGQVEELDDYYPDGLLMPGADAKLPAVQPYKFTGKERLTFGGLNVYDYGPRHHYAPTLSFTTPDPKANDYPWTSPYVHCAGNPVMYTDPTGKDIAILYSGSPHLALLIHNEEGIYEYYSYNGTGLYKLTSGSVGGNGHHNLGQKKFNSVQEFLDSDFNSSVSENERYDEANDIISGYEFSEAYEIKTTPKQDAAIRQEFKNQANNGYWLIGHNCGDVVELSLRKGGIVPKSTITGRHITTAANLLFMIQPINTLRPMLNILLFYSSKYNTSPFPIPKWILKRFKDNYTNGTSYSKPEPSKP